MGRLDRPTACSLFLQAVIAAGASTLGAEPDVTLPLSPLDIATEERPTGSAAVSTDFSVDLHWQAFGSPERLKEQAEPQLGGLPRMAGEGRSPRLRPPQVKRYGGV